VAPAGPFLETRQHLFERRAKGLHAGMAFTYRNPVRSTDPSASVPGATSLVVGARRYLRRASGTGRSPRGRVARYAWKDPYAPLRSALEVVAEELRESGGRAVVVADDNALVDREAAVRAGLGWYGKNANVLLPGQGSWFVLGSVITDVALETASGAVADGCGACTRCMRGCPTGAIVAPGVVDARKCLAWLVQAPGVFPVTFRPVLGDRIYGCDDCQEVCPLNRDVPPGPPEAGDRSAVALLELLAMTDGELMHAIGHWYVPQRRPGAVRRNALIALGNVGDGGDEQTRAAVIDALHHDDAIVRGHAVWAAARLGHPEWADGLVGREADPTVQAELAARGDVTARAPA